jgi:hypothetical protein
MHHHGDLHQAIITIGVVVVGVKVGQWASTQIAKWSPGVGAAMGAVFNLGTH